MDLTIKIHFDKLPYKEEVERTRAHINCLLNNLEDRAIPFDEDEGYIRDEHGLVVGNWSLKEIER